MHVYYQCRLVEILWFESGVWIGAFCACDYVYSCVSAHGDMMIKDGEMVYKVRVLDVSYVVACVFIVRFCEFIFF